MTVQCGSPDGDRDGIDVEVVRLRDQPRDLVFLRSTSGAEFVIDENHAQALVLALQAAIAEVQARAVSL